ncbi:AIPR family protein [Macellibacteroides fermentans]
MAANNNTIILEGCIKDFKEQNDLKLNDSEIFELFALTQITKNSNVSFENILNSITDGGNDGGIDSIITLINDEVCDTVDDLKEKKINSRTITKFIFTQCKKEKSFKEGSLDKLITSFPVLLNLGETETSLLKRFNSVLVEKIGVVKESWTQTAIVGGSIFVEINYACNAGLIEVSSAFLAKIGQLEKICKNTFSIDNVKYTNYSSQELLKLYQTHIRNRMSLDFKDTPLSTNFGNNGIGYIGMVNLSKYKEFISSDSGDIREELFESNIRHFQGNVDVNKKIKTTLRTASNKDFWWLNNGITIIAESPTQIGKKLSIDNVQIVNGLQTSYCIYNAYENINNDERAVLVKVIISTDKEIIDEIIESTNYQNVVAPGLLRANEDLQRNIEIFFLSKGYYYDRRKNYYKNQGKPANKIFGIQYTAQAIKSIIGGEPHIARATPTSLLKEKSSYSAIFKNDDNFTAYLNCCIILLKIHSFILNITNREDKSIVINFKLHLSWIITILYLNDINITVDKIASIDPTNIDFIEYEEDALHLLLNSIINYKKTVSGANIINMAKSKEFTLFLKNEVDSILTK